MRREPTPDTKDALVQHLKTAHGYVDTETDPSPEAAQRPGAFGIVRVDHPVWDFSGLKAMHDQDHGDYETGTPVINEGHIHDDVDARSARICRHCGSTFTTNGYGVRVHDDPSANQDHWPSPSGSMLDDALEQIEERRHERDVAFTLEEVNSSYDTLDDRYVVSLIATYPDGNSPGGVSSRREALNYARELANDPDTTWHVYDRKTKTHHAMRHDNEACNQCDQNGGWVISSYGEELGDGPFPIQRCDICLVFDSDLDAAMEFASQNGGGSITFDVRDMLHKDTNGNPVIDHNIWVTIDKEHEDE